MLQERIGWLLTRPVGRPANEVRRYHTSFSYEAGSWNKARRVVAKVEWHPGELYPRVGFIVTNMTRPAERVVMFYNQRGTAEQWIKEGKNAVTWTCLSCQSFKANAVRLQLHALAYNLANFLRTLALPRADCAVVDEHAAPAAGEDRREDRPAWSVDHLPDGRSHGAARVVRENPGRHSRAPSLAARQMLRISARLGLSGVGGRASRCRLVGSDSRSQSDRRPVARASAAFSVISPLLKARFGGYSAVVAGELAVHPGNAG